MPTGNGQRMSEEGMTVFENQQQGELLSAYLDGALNDRHRVEVEQLLARDANARQLLEQLRRTAEAVGRLPRHAAPPSILDDVLMQVERNALLDTAVVRPIGQKGTRRHVRALLSLAAMIVVVAGGVWYMQGGLERRLSPPGSAATPDRVASLDSGTAEESRTPSASPVTPGESALARRGARSRAAPAVRSDHDEVAASPDERRADAARIVKSPLSGNDLQVFQSTLLAAAQVPPLDESATTLRQETIDAHPVRLQLQVRDAAQRTTVASRLETQWASGTAALRESGAAAVGAELSKQTAQLRGRSKTAARGGTEQLVVDVPLSALESMIADVGALHEDGLVVALAAGPVAVEGAEPARETLRRVRAAWESQEAAASSPAGTGAFFSGLFKVLGVDPSTLAPSPAADKAKPADKSSVAEAEPSQPQPPTPSLVERRARKLEESTGRSAIGESLPDPNAETGPSAPLPAATDAFVGPPMRQEMRPEPMVTVVIEVAVAADARRSPLQPRPMPKPNAPPPKPPEKNPVNH